MKKETIEFSNSKLYLKQILKKRYQGLIPSGVILDKTLPGLGATSCEIESERNSIIIEPNSPVVGNKEKKYPNERWNYHILGVNKGVTTQDVINYLNREDVKYKKILSTPDSFYKVTNAFLALKIDYHKSYFLLIDECEKAIQDVDFRPILSFMMREFWLFSHKAMVSATPLIPSDKGFEEQDFKYLKIKPTFDYSHDIVINRTNCVLNAVKDVFAKVKDETICFFTNSIDTIISIIEVLEINDNTKIFCGEDSVAKLKDLGYTNCSTLFDKSDTAKYNFFTSRFFSAIDMELEVTPVVIIVTDNYFAPQTVVDPQTEVKQIIGRFRNPKVLTHHITNIRPDAEVKSREYIESFYQGNYAAYKAIHTLYRIEEHVEQKAGLKAALMQLKFHEYTYLYNNKLCINRYLIDNEIESEKVKKLYANVDNLYWEYVADEFYEPQLWSLIYNRDDRTRYRVDRLNIRELRKEMIAIYDEIFHGERSGTLADYFTDYQLLKDNDYITWAYLFLGKENLEKLKYDRKAIDEVLDFILNDGADKEPLLIRAIYSEFKVGQEYSEGFIKSKLKSLFKKYNATGSVKATNLNDYCSLSARKNIGKNGTKLIGETTPKGYKVLGYLFNINGTKP